MENKLDLRRPILSDKELVLEMMAEFEAFQSAHDGGFWSSTDFSYEDWLQTNLEHELGLNLPDGFVPAIQLVSFDPSGRALGFLSLRLMLNDFLLNHGGHIGYSVRPSQRGRGIAKQMLQQAIDIARSKNITDILVTCHQDNQASRAVILANNGIFENTLEETERYWIRSDE